MKVSELREAMKCLDDDWEVIPEGQDVFFYTLKEAKNGTKLRAELKAFLNGDQITLVNLDKM